jgi:cation diffusion facilitator CzcD-associated flavoprotein CzcO
MSDSILIVGSGFAGLGMAIRLKRAGIHDFTILEQADGVGGTWRANHYPGAACDVESHLYSFSFAPRPGWSRMFAPQPEILDYLEECADRYEIRPHIRFGTRVTSASFDEARGVWRVETSDGRTREARVLVSGCGGLSRPSYPEIPGLEDFSGEVFHTARWKDDYAFDGRRVAVIGTGASAIQVVPEIAPRVARLAVFQRTAPWIVPKLDREIGAQEQARFRRWPLLQKLARHRLYWQHELLAYGFVVDPRVMKLASRLARRHLTRSVANPELRRKLLPSYTLGCKRILLSNDYYQALERDNVELVTDPIERIVPEGIRSRDGSVRELDALVLATGFQAAEAVAPFPIRGRGGRDLSAEWTDGAEAYLGTTVSGFPNLFVIVGPNTGLGHSSMVFMIEAQIRYVLDCIQMLRERELGWVDVKPEVQASYNDELRARLERTVWSTGCDSWYRTRSGKNTTLWPSFTFDFWRRTRRFDAESYRLEPRSQSERVQSTREPSFDRLAAIED